MQLRQAVRRVGQGMARFRRLEIAIAVLCCLTPVGLVLFDACFDTAHSAACAAEDGGIRAAISHYWDMPEALAFYVPLTVASMLFIVNGVLKNASQYNWILGVALLVIVLFDHERVGWAHMIGVGVFFIGNVIVLGLSVARRVLKIGVLLAGLAFFLLGAVIDSAWTANWAFWAEWASLLIITAHYVLVAWTPDDTYRAGSLPWEQGGLSAEAAA